MEFKKFNPIEKEFHFRLNEKSCYKCNCGVCSIEDLSIQDIKEYKVSVCISKESEKEYCIKIAKSLLQYGCEDILHISRFNCGHYSLIEGQHRICIVAHLLYKNANIELNALTKTEDENCYYCVMLKKYNDKLDSINAFQKIFKSKLLKECTDNIKKLENYHILRKL